MRNYSKQNMGTLNKVDTIRKFEERNKKIKAMNEL